MPMNPSDVIRWTIVLFVFVPLLAAIVAFSGGQALRQLARGVLLAAFVGHLAAVLGCLAMAMGKPSSGIGNQVFLLFTLPLGAVGAVWFAVWRGARRAEYLGTLPPADRADEERRDLERAAEAMRKSDGDWQ